MKQLSVLFVIAIFFISGPSFAGDKMFRIGVTQIVSHESLNADQRGFEAALASSGFKEGVQVTYERRNAEGDMAKAKAIAKEFIKTDVDLIHSIATLTTQAVVNNVKDIPVVFSSVTDPVSAGIVPKNSSPGEKTGTNVTGVSDMWPVALQLETHTKFVPAIKKMGHHLQSGRAQFGHSYQNDSGFRQETRAGADRGHGSQPSSIPMFDKRLKQKKINPCLTTTYCHLIFYRKRTTT